MVGCTDSIIDNGNNLPDGEQKEQVLMAVGTEKPEQTRAGNIIYMPNNVRFTAMMLTRSTADEDYNYQLPFNAYMLVDTKDFGNSLYYQSDYRTPTTLDQDYKNDDDANIFYWQNRLKHGFIGYIDDYNKALPQAQGVAGATYSPQPLSLWNNEGPATSDGKEDKNKTGFLYTMKKDGTILSWQQYVKIDLRNNPSITSMSMQKDPLIACEEKIPESSSPEKNRVYLTFRHQLAQVQVNLKGSEESADITADQIDAVALLGVSNEAYVFPYPEYGFTETSTPIVDANGDPVLDADGNETYDVTQTWGIVRQGETKTDLLRKAYAVPLTLDEQNANPPAGSRFDMFEMADGKQATGYLKGFEAIAFGDLKYLRIVWHEKEGNVKSIEHVIQFPITDNRFKKLESGKRYIINLELRLGTVASVKAEIVDWISDDPSVYYESSGTVVKNN